MRQGKRERAMDRREHSGVGRQLGHLSKRGTEGEIGIAHPRWPNTLNSEGKGSSPHLMPSRGVPCVALSNLACALRNLKSTSRQRNETRQSQWRHIRAYSFSLHFLTRTYSLLSITKPHNHYQHTQQWLNMSMPPGCHKSFPTRTTSLSFHILGSTYLHHCPHIQTRQSRCRTHVKTSKTDSSLTCLSHSVLRHVLIPKTPAPLFLRLFQRQLVPGARACKPRAS